MIHVLMTPTVIDTFPEIIFSETVTFESDAIQVKSAEEFTGEALLLPHCPADRNFGTREVPPIEKVFPEFFDHFITPSA
jgi:hypothetical protein